MSSETPNTAEPQPWIDFWQEIVDNPSSDERFRYDAHIQLANWTALQQAAAKTKQYSAKWKARSRFLDRMLAMLEPDGCNITGAP